MYMCVYVHVCLERAHGCLGAWEGGPVVPGPPPLGPWGASPGGVPDPNYKDHFPYSTPRIRIKIAIDIDVDFWSFWTRSWVPLWLMLGSLWRLFRPKLTPEPSSNRLIFEKVSVHETI